jgi:RHS repeat-associated protein
MSYKCDDENRLTAAQVLYQADSGNWQGWRTVFEYDGLSRLRCRLEFTVEDGDKSYDWYFDHGVQYIYDGMRVIQERNEVYTPTVSYTRGTDLSGSLQGAGGIGGLLARSTGNYSSGNWTNHAYYHADGNGNITCLISAGQSVVASYRYDPFGNTISKTGTLADANVYRFSSKEIHVNSGMYYYGYRFYDPNLQRWINRDPIMEAGGLNLYGFAANAPIMNIDLYGDNFLPPSLTGPIIAFLNAVVKPLFENCQGTCAQNSCKACCITAEVAIDAAAAAGTLFGIAGTAPTSGPLGPGLILVSGVVTVGWTTHQTLDCLHKCDSKPKGW